jgi:hypothetical protein
MHIPTFIGLQKDMKFYDTIVVPMAKDCVTEEDLGTAADVLDQKKELCKRVKLVKKLNQWHENHKQNVGT